MAIVIAILAKDKEIFLPTYLKCIYEQTYNKKNIHLYIRTNDNKDKTPSILKEFIDAHKDEYASIYYDDTDICSDLKKYEEHEWNPHRFSVLGKIRQESIDYAIKHAADYFVADCDNFIIPTTIQKMYNMRSLGVISPMLKSENVYSNFHYTVDGNGYFVEHPEYYNIYYQVKKGIFTVGVVHCVYFIHNDTLKDIVYLDGSNRHEYVIFSDTLRNKKINQWLDNTERYGTVSFSKTKEELDKCLKVTGFII